MPYAVCRVVSDAIIAQTTALRNCNCVSQRMQWKIKGSDVHSMHEPIETAAGGGRASLAAALGIAGRWPPAGLQSSRVIELIVCSLIDHQLVAPEITREPLCLLCA